MKFTHLHVHSHYSLLDGLPKIDQLLDYAKESGMDSIALTDHGVLYGAVEFYKKAKERGLKPIIGCEMYTAFERMNQKRPNIDDKKYHLLLLAKNKKGYENLVELVTKAHLEGFYYKPRIDDELLKKHSEGLICMTACIKGKIPRLILSKKIEEAEELALKYQKMFGKGNFYLELQNHPNIPEQKTVNDKLREISKKHNIPLVATNDSHYLKPEDAEAQDILMLINTGADRNDPERITMKADDFSLRKPEEMIKDFKDTPEAVENTQKIADACNFEFELGKTKLPHFKVPNGKTPDQYLKDLCYQGLKKRYKKTTEEIKERLERELSVIKETGFASYFLIVQDFVNWAKDNRIVVGPGRGSVGGSLVSYLLNITNIDPLKHDLLFERFLNPARVSSMPDIDLDFTDRRRDEVIEYVAQKYGRDRVAQIITFGTMASRAVIRDVGRALGYTYSYCDQIAKMIPFGSSLSETINDVSEFRKIYKTDEEAKRLIDLAKKLEGVVRHASTHACGVVISEEPLVKEVPLQHPTQNDQSIVTQYEMHAIEDLGLLKMDFLGLKNLTIIEDTLARIYVVREGKKIDLESIPTDDQKTYKLLQEGKTAGIFQLEGQGLTRYLKSLKPTEFEDLVTMIALYRPGPMELIPSYIKRKHGKEKVDYIHPKLEPILKNTYGIMIFQEQLMQMAREVAGFSLSEADILRKAVGKKIKSLLHSQEKKFIKGVMDNGVEKKVAEKLWQWILPFARYGFNKCLTGETKIFNSKGESKTIEELYKEKGRSVISLTDNLKLKPGKISKITKNGVKPVYEITTKSGRKIQATKEHRFFTEKGWERLESLKEKEKVALARRWPVRKSNIKWPEHRLALLGYVISEGNTCHPHSFYLYTNSEEELKEYTETLEKFKNTKATVSKRERKGRVRYSVYAGRVNLKEKSEAVEWIMEELGLKYKKATQKALPEDVFLLENEQISLLLGKMWNGDGCISPRKNGESIYYATSSEKLATQVQNLLLRLGIFSKIHKKKFNYRKKFKTGWTVNFSRYDNIIRFAENVHPYLVGKRKRGLEEILSQHPIINGNYKNKLFARGTLDTVPVNLTRNEIRTACQESGNSMRAVAREAEVSYRLFYLDPKKQGYQRETLNKIAGTLKSEKLTNLAQSDIYWDRIKSIKYKGRKETYDLTIEKNHNFLANGFIVHNSHSAAYATIAYQTAYLKAHYPVEFMASLLTSERNDIEKIAYLIEECKKMDIEVLPPDINESLKNFTVVPEENKIRFGLWAIKNVGENVIDAIVKEKKENGQFKSIGDFVERVSSKDLNKRSLESLIKVGAFDKLGERNELLSNMERLLEASRENQKNKANGQKGLFEGQYFSSDIRMERCDPAKNRDKLNWEKELLGLYITSHPLENYRNVLRTKAFSISKISPNLVNRRVRIGGVISDIKKILTKNGNPMLFIKVEDLTSKIEVVVFPNLIQKNPAVFQNNKIVLISGRIDNRKGDTKVVAESAEELITEA